ncbi:MAG: hypothetical protein LZF62_380016 [Nitrospira sp.]|nr:MAG: hypothetical protein LZF62_380016 [Nitrospira sp.]
MEHRQAERRVQALLFSSMVGVLVGLMVATFMESEHRAPPPEHRVPGLHDRSTNRTTQATGTILPK